MGATRQDPLNLPLYSTAELSRFAAITSDRVRRWLRGYSYQIPARGRVIQPPVVRRSPAPEDPAGTFLDLVELLFIKGFLDEGISLQRIRRALDEARSVFTLDHPFARERFFTDGRAIFLQVREKPAPALLELLTGGQWVLAPVILQLAKRIEFDGRTHLARRWHPMGPGGRVVVDPTVSFGAPSVDGRRTKTSTVYDLFVAEGRRAESVAAWLNLPLADVKAAVDFESRLAA